MQAVEYVSEQLRFSVYNQNTQIQTAISIHTEFGSSEKMNCDTNCNFSSNQFSSNTSKYASRQADMSAVCVCLSITHTHTQTYTYIHTRRLHHPISTSEKARRERGKKIQRTTITSLFNQGGQSVFPH